MDVEDRGTLAPKDPSELVYYTLDVAAALNAGATVVSATWAAPGLTVSGEQVTDTTAVAKLAGGQHGQDYRIRVTITTSDGETLVAGVTLPVRRAGQVP